jgi:hypothetical protein
MSARYCASCGAPLPAGAQFCTFCGTAVPATPPAGAVGGSSSVPPPPPGPLPSSYGAPMPPPPRRSKAKVVLVIFVVLILVAGVAVFAFAFLPGPSSDQVDIQEINIWAPDNVCGLNSNPVGFAGYNDTPGDVDQLELSMPNFNATSCTIAGLVTNTSGFSVSGLSLPLTIPGSSNPGNPVSENLNLTLNLPNTTFNGNVNLVVR